MTGTIEVHTAIDTKLERSSAPPRRIAVARVLGVLAVAVIVGAFWSLVLVSASGLTGMSLRTSIIIGSLIGIFCAVIVSLATGRSR